MIAECPNTDALIGIREFKITIYIGQERRRKFWIYFCKSDAFMKIAIEHLKTLPPRI
jgi:hypothetical protein